ncbi:MAG: hypothetical protein ACREXP_29745 [Steroidobacteraceae bacterium]
MPAEYDIVVRARDGTLVAVIECKRMKLRSDAEATSLRRNLTLHGGDPGAAYFMLALSTCLFLWKGDAAADAPPQFSAAVKPVLKSYLGPVADQPGGPLSRGRRRSRSSATRLRSWGGRRTLLI